MRQKEGPPQEKKPKTESHSQSPDEPLPDLIPDIDDMTLLELADLDCQTHKLNLPSKSRPFTKPRRLKKNLRSGGFLVSVTPDGFVTDIKEFLGAESCAQRYVFLLRLKQLYPELKVILQFVKEGG